MGKSAFVTKDNYVPVKAPKSFADFPSYDDLPNKRRFWVWGPPGSEQEALGMLNMLTPELVASAAAKEIKSGDRVGLGWTFDYLDFPPFKRMNFKHDIKWISFPFALDDEYHMNPQQSSQWDGFRHHSQFVDPSIKSRDALVNVEDPDEASVWYGGASAHELLDRSNDRLSIHHWAKKGIAGRGVLLDYAAWAEEQKITYSTFDKYAIPLSDLLKVAERYNVKFEPGDILCVRIGVTKEWLARDEEWKTQYQKTIPPNHAGIQQSDELLRFIWDNHFTALVGDAIAWELYPNPDQSISVHQTALAGWGVPLGELFDLEALSALCKEKNKYSFFFTSMPFNAIGGVSSAPNAMAIF
ncbi:uncharacterized protein V2V93DRAFT_366574 [Kockiozyma suomiensis]|uniref:uncharacterized protein n=1 Tax=Kockiozyma suomiensis TaxID=1337062 RepID=UPI0033437F22